MSVLFGQVVGLTGPTGPTGDIGDVGQTGDTGPKYPYEKATVTQNGICAYSDIRLNRSVSINICETADSSTSGTKILTTTPFASEDLPVAYQSYQILKVVHFLYAQTYAIPVSLQYTACESNGRLTPRTAPIYINGAITSATNPFLWAAGSVILFAIQTTRAYFMSYLGNTSANKNKQAAPFYHYSTTPLESDLPIRPCFYHVASTNNWYYCDGLA